MTYTKADLPEAQIRAVLDADGLLTGFDVQMMSYAEPTTATSRVVLIRVDGSGATSTEDHQFPTMLIAVFGAVADSDKTGLRIKAEEIAKKLRNLGPVNRIAGVQNLTNPFGPYFTDSGRPVFEINFTLALSEEI